MNKKLFLIAGGVTVLAVAVGGLVFFGRSGSLPLTQTLNRTLNKEIGVGDDVCAEFPKEFVSAAIGKPILKTDRFDYGTTHNCQYFVNATDYAIIKVESLSVENQRQGQISLGQEIKQDPRITMEHMVAWQSDDVISEIYLILGPNRYVAIDRNSLGVTNEQEVALATAVAERVTKGENRVTTPTVTETKKDVVTETTEKTTIESFFSAINQHKPSDAVAMLVSSLTADDSNKQAWGAQFNAFQSVTVTAMEGASAVPVPYYGWDNGSNIRWITLERVAGAWKIAGIATGP